MPCEGGYILDPGEGEGPQMRHTWDLTLTLTLTLIPLLSLAPPVQAWTKDSQ